MAAKQVLDIVLRGDDEHIDPGLVHQSIKPPCIEWRFSFALSHIEHDWSPGTRAIRGNLGPYQIHRHE